MEKKKRRPRRKFTTEFKLEAVELIEKIGTMRASEELDVDSSTLRDWRKKLNPSKKNIQSQSKSYSDLEKENRRLTKELGYMKEINKVLKKSTAIFSKDHLGGFK